MAKRTEKPATLSAALGFESHFWDAANALRGSMDDADCEHVVLGLIFLNYISDAFQEHRKKLFAEPYADPEDPDEYRAENIFCVPREAWWSERNGRFRDRPDQVLFIDACQLGLMLDRPHWELTDEAIAKGMEGRWTRSASTATCSRHVGTSVPRQPPTTASRSRKKMARLVAQLREQ